MTDQARCPSERLFWLQGPRAGLVLGTLALIASIVFVVVLLQRQYGLPGWTTEQEVEFKAEPKKDGKAVRASIPRNIRTDLAVEKLRVFEDGTELQRSRDRKSVVKQGGGLFNAKGGSLWLSSLDGSDPSVNGHKYVIRAPRVIPDRRLVIFCALAALFLWLSSRNRWLVNTLRASSAPVAEWSPSIAALILFVGAFFIRLLFMMDHGDYSDAFSIKGMPYSDALSWMELSTNMYEGNGISGSAFDGQRPGYALLLATLFLVTGPSLFAAQMLNVVAGALTVSLVYLIGHFAVNRTVGVAAALGIMMMPWQLSGTVTIMSAPPGQALTILSVLLLWIACLRGKWWWFFIAGLMLALANLVRTYTITAFPLYGLVITVIAWRGRWGWKRFISHSAILVGGIVLVMAPWLARQKLSADVATLSTYSMDLLYGTAKYGKWDHQPWDEAKAEGIDPGPGRGELHKFYSKRFGETVKEDPGAYLSARAADWWVAINQFDPVISPFRLAATLVILFAGFGLMRRHGPLVAMGALAAVAAALSFGTTYLASSMPDGFASLYVLLAIGVSGFALGAQGRIALALLAATLLGGTVMSAMIGNLALNRTLVMIHWTIFLIYLIGIHSVFRGIDRWFSRQKDADEDEKESMDGNSELARGPIPFVTVSTVGALAFALIGAIILPLKMVARSDEDKAQIQLSASARTEADTYFRSRLGELSDDDDPAIKSPEEFLYAEPVILGDYRCLLKANEDVGHWSRAFEPRPDERTLFFVRIGALTSRKSDLVATNFPGNQMQLDARTHYVLVGIRNYDSEATLGKNKLVIEALGLAPYDLETGRADFSRVLNFDITPAGREVLTAEQGQAGED